MNEKVRTYKRIAIFFHHIFNNRKIHPRYKAKSLCNEKGGRGREKKYRIRCILTTYNLFQMPPHSRKTRVTSRTTGSSNGMTDSKRPSLSILQGFRCTYELGKIPFTVRFFVEKPLYQPAIVGNPISPSAFDLPLIVQYFWLGTM